MVRRHPQAGFSVLEALVAVALIAVAFLPLLVLQGQLTRTAIGAERAEIALRAKQNALEYLKALNPSLRPEGSEPLGDTIMEWYAESISDTRPAVSMFGEKGRFDVTLYKVYVRLNYPDGRAEIFEVRRTGWIATRAITEV